MKKIIMVDGGPRRNMNTAMKKILFFITLLVFAFTAEAKRKAEKIILDSEFNPWFQYEGPLEKVSNLVDNSHSTAKLPSKMDKIEPNSNVYEPSKMVFRRIRPAHVHIPLKEFIEAYFVVPKKIEHMPTEVDLKRENNR